MNVFCLCVGLIFVGYGAFFSFSHHKNYVYGGKIYIPYISTMAVLYWFGIQLVTCGKTGEEFSDLAYLLIVFLVVTAGIVG